MSATATTATTPLSVTFETATCARCGGSGRMPYSAYAGVCFKCNGRGSSPTPAGRAARKKFDTEVTSRCVQTHVSALNPGDVFRHGANSGWVTCVAVTAHDTAWEIVTKKQCFIVGQDTTVEVRPAGTLRAAIERVARLKGATVTAAGA